MMSRSAEKERELEEAQDALEGIVSVLSLELEARKITRNILQGLEATGLLDSSELHAKK